MGVMHWSDLMTKIHIAKGNIAQFSGDAIVEAHHKNHSDKDCGVGRAKLILDSDTFKKHVIKTIVPRWHGGKEREIEMLARSQIACLDKAAEAGASDVAFPVISTDYKDYPSREAADVAMSATALWIDHFGQTSSLQDVHFLCDDEDIRKSLEDALDNTGLSA